MKVKNIAFSGFAAAILAMGAAQADVPQIASKSYVDVKVGAVGDSVDELTTNVTNLTTNLEENYTTTENLGDVITTNITNALESDDSKISQALAGKVDSSEKTSTIAEGTDEAKIPTVGAVTAYTQQAISDTIGEGIDSTQIAAGAVITNAIADGAVTTPKIADKNVTTEKLSDELNAKIDAAQTAEDVSKAIAGAVTADGALKDALAEKVTSTQVTAALEAYTIPVPQAECSTESGHCLLSVDTAGKLTWVEVTAPYGDTGTTQE